MIFFPETPQPCTVGGKAEGLIRLREWGLPGLPFLVIPAEEFDPLLPGPINSKQEFFAAKTRFEKWTFNEADARAVKQRLESWGFPEKKVVVRSSIGDEDGAQHAFPGMMDSFLHVDSWEALETSARNVAASAFSERAAAYREQNGLSWNARPAVIVQLQAEADFAGVAFTTFPDYPRELALHYVEGYGDALMQGAAEPQEAYFLKPSGVLRRCIPAEGGGLSPQQLALTFESCARVEEKAGKPMDVEFVWEKGKLYLLQARPITRKIPEIQVLDNSNIQESYNGVTTPLTFSFARRAYATVYRQTMATLGLSKSKIAENEPVITELLAQYQGRVYYQINNWYRGLQLLPSFRQNKADMERMMGVEEPVDFVVAKEKSLSEKLRLLPGLMLNLTRLLWAFFTLKGRIRRFQSHFNEAFRQFWEESAHTADLPVLAERKRWLDETLMNHWSTPIINDFFVMMANGSVVRLLQRAGLTPPDEWLARYLTGDPEIESVQPTHALMALAAYARAHPELCAVLTEAQPGFEQHIPDLFPEFQQQVHAFIQRYGDRTVGELKLETVTMRTDIRILYKYLHNYLGEQNNPVLHSTEKTRIEAEGELRQALKNRGPVFRYLTQTSLRLLRQGIRQREALRLQRTRLFGMYRHLYLEMGRQLAERGLLAQARDVFFLNEEELLHACLYPQELNRQTVSERQAEFAHFKNLKPASRVEIPPDPLRKSTSQSLSDGKLHGTGCVRGRVTGEVVVITSPEDDLDVRGKIVCASRTDPGWAALFPACKAVLIEKGSSLSHSVILLRELGIPTIINIPGLTHHLRSGQQVRVDAETGEITLLT